VSVPVRHRLAPKPPLSPRVETICVRVLRKCNLTCAHCWAGSSPHQTEELAAEEVLHFLKQMARYGLKHVSVSGGEPFLYDELSQVVLGCLEQGLFVTVTTNGLWGRRFAELAERRGFPKDQRLRVRISLDGTQSVHDAIRGSGSYEQAIEAVVSARRRQGWIGVNTVVVPGVYGCLEALLVEVRDLQVDDWALIAPLPKGSYQGKGMDSDSVREAVSGTLGCQERIGFAGRIRFWDFQVREYGHLVLESDGRILMPGFTEATDRSLGDFRTVNFAHLQQAVAQDAAAHREEFYSWRGWSVSTPEG
jgi:MoaA/NifB/PqqE/SkfB family radical SAM enzyme